MGSTFVADRPPLVLLHGVGIGAEMWQPQIDGLAARFTVHAPTLPGFGEDAGSVVDVREAADRIAEELATSGMGPAHIAGLSLGGMVAIALAARHPTAVRSLIVSGAQVRVPRTLQFLLLGIGRVLPERALMAGTNLPAEATAEMRAAERRLARRMGKEGILAMMQAAANADLTGELRDITCPLLVLCGERDNRLNRGAARRIAGAVSGAELRFIPDVGHLWNLERPDRFNAELVRFITAVEGSA
jgi:3-oxoadipate enol-lactonase